jgi:hypothetical protein
MDQSVQEIMLKLKTVFRIAYYIELTITCSLPHTCLSDPCIAYNVCDRAWPVVNLITCRYVNSKMTASGNATDNDMTDR